MKARDGGGIELAADNSFKVTAQQRGEHYTLGLSLESEQIAGLRIEALPLEVEAGQNEIEVF